jgi:tetratricopeptide (TPR) repeat protein
MTGHSGVIAAALLAGAVATGACSNSSKTTGAKSEKPTTAVPQTTATSYVPEPAAAPASTKAVSTRPVTFKEGEAAYQAGKYADATETFTRLTEEKPNNAWGHYMLGLSASKAGDPVKAMKAFDEALRLDPKHVKSLINSARVLIDQKQPEKALPRLDQAAMLAPDSFDVQRLFARAYEAQGKTDEAIDAYKHAIELNDKDAWSNNNLGLLLFKQGRAGEAVPFLTRAVELRKDVAVFSNNLGMALEHTGKFQDAAAAYRVALDAEPSNEKAKRNLARVETLKDAPQVTGVSSKVTSEPKKDEQAGVR